MTKLYALLILSLVAGVVEAHPDGHSGDSSSLATGSEKWVSRAGISLPEIAGPRPWSEKPLLNTPGRFQIAIVTDRTGGHRPGIWMNAVEKLNQLRPEFVVSVGDLIEGYTEDEATVQSQWEEFVGFIDRMEMRFFFVAGNHDLTNSMMHRVWRERFGPEWYSFDYRGVHFLCLNSEDPRQHISEKQLQFIEEDLEQAEDARWTLVFLHKPLWTYAERGLANNGEDPTNWKRVEAMLVDRPHTVFAGHVHHYVQYERDGHNYYSLATTGGGSQLRGNEYGEFDHVTWLTMETEGPHVVNLRLDGILPADVVTEQSAKRFGDFLRLVRVEVDPIMVDDSSNRFSKADLRVRLVNDLGRKTSLVANVDGLPLAGLTVDPEEIWLAVGPTGSAEQKVRVRFEEPIGLDRLRRATLTATIEAVADDEGPSLRAERIVPIVIDSRFLCPEAPEGFVVDGVLEAWPDEPYSVGDRPLVLGAQDDWKGPDDGSFEVSTLRDSQFLYVQVKVTDEKVLADDDRILVLLDGRTAPARLDDPRQRRGTSVLTVPSPPEGGAVDLEVGAGWRGRPIQGARAAGQRTDSGYEIELAVPIDRLQRSAEGGWESFQLAVVQMDADDPGAKPSEIVWRASTSYRQSNENYARFYPN
ncbi:MAG: metallophosphoesterase [Planctomycetota bacterium]